MQYKYEYKPDVEKEVKTIILTQYPLVIHPVLACSGGLLSKCKIKKILFSHRTPALFNGVAGCSLLESISTTASQDFQLCILDMLLWSLHENCSNATKYDLYPDDQRLQVA